MKKKIFIWLFGEYDPNDWKYIVAFIATILMMIGIIFLFNHTRDFRREACIQREMYNGHVSREVAEKITESRWFYF